MKAFLFLLFVGFAGFAQAAEPLRLASPFRDHAVLQRDRAFPIWGTASPNAVVNVLLGEEAVKATANAAGIWKAVMAPRPGSAVPVDLKVGEEGGGQIVVKDLLFGDVWLVGGGDEMGQLLKTTSPGKVSETLRYFNGTKGESSWPEEFRDGEWLVCSAKTAKDFPAVAFFFAQSIQEAVDVPIGLIDMSSRDAAIEALATPLSFSQAPALAEFAATLRRSNPAFPEGQAAQKAWLQAMQVWSKSAVQKLKGGEEIPLPPPQPGGEGAKNSKSNPSRVYNAMVAPIIPYACKGVIWHQGTSNDRDPLYFEKMKALITGWREAWGEEMPFYFVQIPSMGEVRKLRRFDDLQPRALEREAQRQLLELPRTGMVVSIDLSKKDPGKDAKQLGFRLAQWALRQDYGKNDVVPSGPLFERTVVENEGVRVHFRHGEGGLVAADKKEGNLSGGVSWIALKGADGKWTEETAIIDGSTVFIQNPKTVEPVEICYAWAGRPEGSNLFNAAGLPASPFRAPVVKSPEQTTPPPLNDHKSLNVLF